MESSEPSSTIANPKQEASVQELEKAVSELRGALHIDSEKIDPFEIHQLAIRTRRLVERITNRVPPIAL